jgi:hypothetical protein
MKAEISSLNVMPSFWACGKDAVSTIAKWYSDQRRLLCEG